ncbi:6-phosphogluconolactonase, cycloisomerase 2 family [Actinacidiphila yanglinensis]|uniref:6-phosphogluconolactonase, cycloisomerase 2 family n=1 Tax=Actinacidiphila yanglinensis TaxID=310779 RepID=A0A1H6DXY8_9ACTN|nr:lactonase family protein [Actinacidiphila yanglinensis]SEG89914.1 6-phosphogluconolactonase, cycloisomerase 2 family [Actinacidiphila yanglinensis]
MAAHAYIGSFTSAGGHGLTAAGFDPGTGALTALGHNAEVPNPSFLTASADGRTLYAVGETDPEGSAAAFSLADPAAPKLLGAPVKVRGGAPTHLALHRGHLVTANYSAPGSVSVVAVEDGGALGAVRWVLEHEGDGPNQERQEAPHAHAVLPDPTGHWLLSVDLGTDSVRVCELDPASGELEVERELGLRSGIGPRHLAFHPGGEHAYVMNELDSVVTVCRWDAGKGSLRPLAEARVLPEGTQGDNFPSELVVSADGRFAWAANRGHDSIAVLGIDESGERLELLDTVSCGGSWPRHLTLDPSGSRLYAANEHSGDVSWFDVDAATGIPKQAGALALPAVSCVLFV